MKKLPLFGPCIVGEVDVILILKWHDTSVP